MSTRKLNPGAQHIANNFALFGFGSETSAVVQCVKELLENSIDACKQCKKREERPEVSVMLDVVEEHCDTLLVSVTDNGIGMKDPKKLLQCFETTKIESTSEPVYTTGRFGVGLTACLIYSCANCQCPVRVTTKTADSEKCLVADFALDAVGNPSVLQSEEHSLIMNTGTKINIYLPWSVGCLANVTTTLDEMLSNLSLLPTTFVNTTLTIPADDGPHLRQYPAWPNATGNLTIEDYQIRLTERLVERMAAAQNGRQVRAVAATEVQTAGGRVVTTVAVTSVNDASQVVLFDESCSMGVTLLRCANGVPLLDYLDDGTSCAISAALRAVRWRVFGHSLSLSLYRDTNAAQGLLQPPRWVLQRLSPPEANSEAANTALHVLIVCDIQAAHIPFANLRKTCIGSEDKQLMDAMGAGIKKCVEQLQEQPFTADIFRSKRDSEVSIVSCDESLDSSTQLARISSVYIPSVAASIAKMVSLAGSSDIGLHNLLLQMCSGVEDSDDAETAHLSAVLEQTLKDLLNKRSRGEKRRREQTPLES